MSGLRLDLSQYQRLTHVLGEETMHHLEIVSGVDLANLPDDVLNNIEHLVRVEIGRAIAEIVKNLAECTNPAAPVARLLSVKDLERAKVASVT